MIASPSSVVPRGRVTNAVPRAWGDGLRHGRGDRRDACVLDRLDAGFIRYAQCWEDADVLLEALGPQAGGTCLSIVSGGENTLSLLTLDPSRVVAVDANGAQLACLRLKMAAFRCLTHPELLELIGSRASSRRWELYRKCRGELPRECREFWDHRADDIRRGLGSVGKFERYLDFMRNTILRWALSRRTVDRVLEGGTPVEIGRFYDEQVDQWRWRVLFDLLCSRRVLGWLGREPVFFSQVNGAVGARVRERVREGILRTNPGANPYLHWILRGVHGSALPHAWRAKNFETIRARLDRIEIRHAGLEETLVDGVAEGFDAFNLSDVFEYLSEPSFERCLEKVAAAARDGARLAYWNLLVPRRAPSHWDRLRPLRDVAAALHQRDRVFFYETFVVEEVVK